MNYIAKISLLLTGLATFGWNTACRGAEAQRDTVGLSLYFRQGDDLLLVDYRGNQPTIEKLSDMLRRDSIENIFLVSITGSASPEGNADKNSALALRRAKVLKSYICRQAPLLDPDRVQISANTDFDRAWLEAVEKDVDMPRRDRVLEILRSSASVATKWANIQLLQGPPAKYMERVTFPYLRNVVSCVVVLNRPEVPSAALLPDQAATAVEATAASDRVSAPIPASAVMDADTAVAESVGLGQKRSGTLIKKPLFALKTNLLFDAMSMLNLEVEVPIGKRFSVAGELIFPWWLLENQQYCLQLFSGNVEGRYWFGNRTTTPKGKPRQKLTGWFAGLYAGGGYYDIEKARSGYQGEFFIALGLSGGYAHTINKCGNLRMEYSLGIGYMQTDYRHYIATQGSDQQWHLYRQNDGKFSWFGPTRVKVSLVWMLNYKKKGGVK